MVKSFWNKKKQI